MPALDRKSMGTCCMFKSALIHVVCLCVVEQSNVFANVAYINSENASLSWLWCFQLDTLSKCVLLWLRHHMESTQMHDHSVECWVSMMLVKRLVSSVDVRWWSHTNQHLHKYSVEQQGRPAQLIHKLIYLVYGQITQFNQSHIRLARYIHPSFVWLIARTISQTARPSTERLPPQRPPLTYGALYPAVQITCFIELCCFCGGYFTRGQVWTVCLDEGSPRSIEKKTQTSQNCMYICTRHVF